MGQYDTTGPTQDQNIAGLVPQQQQQNGPQQLSNAQIYGPMAAQIGGAAISSIGQTKMNNKQREGCLMAQLHIICHLRPGTQERWRRLYQEVAGSPERSLNHPVGKRGSARCRFGWGNCCAANSCS